MLGDRKERRREGRMRGKSSGGRTDKLDEYEIQDK
jgi:hypothetical protein